MKSNQSAVKSNSGVDGLSSSISMAENSPLSVRAFLTLSACSVVTPRQIVMRLLSARTPTTLYIDREIMAAIRSASRAKERCGGLPYNADRRTRSAGTQGQARAGGEFHEIKTKEPAARE